MRTKKVRPEGRTENQIDLSSGCKAVAAVDRTVLSGLERNLAGLSALSADSVEHLAGAAGFASGRLAGGTAGLASLGLVGEALLRVELLLTGGEHELGATFFAD